MRKIFNLSHYCLQVRMDYRGVSFFHGKAPSRTLKIMMERTIRHSPIYLRRNNGCIRIMNKGISGVIVQQKMSMSRPQRVIKEKDRMATKATKQRIGQRKVIRRTKMPQRQI